VIDMSWENVLKDRFKSILDTDANEMRLENAIKALKQDIAMDELEVERRTSGANNPIVRAISMLEELLEKNKKVESNEPAFMTRARRALEEERSNR
tara:strand:+ start:213 stop:500 length:288 start_codon:yes stop_codon:yes gene_type:complete